MTATSSLLESAQRVGLSVTLSGDRLYVRYPEYRKQELATLIAELRERRSELVHHLRSHGIEDRDAPDQQTWPPESEMSLRKFARPYARLFPLIGKRVWTPRGPGILRQVLGERLARVALDTDPLQMQNFSPNEIEPMFGLPVVDGRIRNLDPARRQHYGIVEAS